MSDSVEKRIRELQKEFRREDFVSGIYTWVAVIFFFGGAYIAAILSPGNGWVMLALWIGFLLLAAWVMSKEEDYKEQFKPLHDELGRLRQIQWAHEKKANASSESETTDSYMGSAQVGSWQQLRDRVIARDGGKCKMCGSTNRLTVDHIQELSLGGTNAMSNLRTLCATCHEDRHGRNFMDREFEVDSNYGRNYRLNPKVAALIRAQSTKRGVGIKYVDRVKQYSERVIHPKRIWSDPKTHRVYVSAYDELDGDDRTFKLSRMKLSKTRLNFYDNPTNSYTNTSSPDPEWLRRNGF